MSKSLLSVIVCTLDRYQDIDFCLSALDPSLQTTNQDFEVIVIEQTPPERRLKDLKADYPYIRYIPHDDIGLSAARNFGIKQAKGDLIGFVDDDAVPSKDWVEQVYKSFAGPNQAWVKVCGGRVQADYRRGEKPAWINSSLEKHLSCIHWYDTPKPLQKGQWIAGANMIFRRDVLDGAEPFNVSLGRKGKSLLMSNEETELTEKIGLSHILYNPYVQVNHIIQEERLHQSWFRKRIYWQAISDAIAGRITIDIHNANNFIKWYLVKNPAGLYNFRAFSVDCPTAEIFETQLGAIYALSILGIKGFDLT